MDFRKALGETCFSLHLKSNTKDGIIDELIDLMVDAGKLEDREGARAAILAREKKMSTGMQSGVAIPHGKTATIEGLITAFGLKREGVDFDSMDGEPSRIFIMTLSSSLQTGPHLQYLAETSRMLSCPAVRDEILEAESIERVIEILTER